MVYQLRDDILDITATNNQLGKPAGQDLAEGIYNLPTIYALRDPTSVINSVRCLARSLDDDDRERARKLVVATDGIERTISPRRRLPAASAHRSRSCRTKTCVEASAR
jgi:heptaprenyl diphosphate synthase